jgi:hypothetical protein
MLNNVFLSTLGVYEVTEVVDDTHSWTALHRQPIENFTSEIGLTIAYQIV